MPPRRMFRSERRSSPPRLHTNPMQVISINGKPVNFPDWQDTINFPPGATIVLRIHRTDWTGKAVFHCHLVFHEYHGMMGTFQILRNPMPAQVSANSVIYMDPTGNSPADFVSEERTLWAHPGLTGLILFCHLRHI